MNYKKLCLIFIVLFVLSIVPLILVWARNSDLYDQISSLETINYDLEVNAYDFENRIEELEEELSSCNEEKDNLNNSYEELTEQFDYLTERYYDDKVNYNQVPQYQYNSSSGYSSYNNNTPTFNQSYNSKLTKVFHNNGNVIALEFENLHTLLKYTNTEFSSVMKTHGYELLKGSDEYMHQKASCCLSIKRTNSELQIIYTGNVNSDIVQIMMKNGINSQPYGKFRRYSYKINGKQYYLNFKSDNSATHIVLQY